MHIIIRKPTTFFYEKNMSQWNEPTYSCIWLNIAGWRYKDAGKIANYICGDGMKKAMEYMNIYQMIVFLGAFVGVICCFKKKNILCCALILIVLGGFYIIWYLKESLNTYCHILSFYVVFLLWEWIIFAIR